MWHPYFSIRSYFLNVRRANMNSNTIKENFINKTTNTPCYILDYDVLNNHIDKMLQAADGKIEFCYAMKANPYVIGEVNKKIPKIEVCSPGELEICRHYGIDGQSIVFSGVNKNKGDIEKAFLYGVDIITIESMKHFELVREYCVEHNCEAKILLRLTSGAQFGMEEEQIRTIIADRAEYPMLHILGIHYFTGTQKKKIEKDKEELNQLVILLNELKRDYSYEANILEYGLGLSVPYFEGEDFEHIYRDLQEMVDYVTELALSCKVVFELGRYIVSSSGVYCTKVDDIKKSHEKNFCIVDGGIHQINYYGQNMAMRTPIIEHIKENASTNNVSQEWCICGSLCTFADVLVRKAHFNNLEIGDILAFYYVGAYSITEAPYLFLSRTMPTIYQYQKENGIKLIRKEIEAYQINSDNQM